ncbi:MAG: hypothetical protein JXQ97_15745 [Natronospirillum sp.]
MIFRLKKSKDLPAAEAVQESEPSTEPEGKTAPAAAPLPPQELPTEPPSASNPDRCAEADPEVARGREGQIFLPPTAPRTIEETGLSDSFLVSLTAKILNEAGTMTPAEIAGVIKLPKLVCRMIIKEMIRLMLVEAQGLESDDVKSDIRYSLTDRGKFWAIDAMKVSQYIGPAPVTLEAFEAQVAQQSINHEEIHREELDDAFSHLVIPKILKAQLGPAANSGRSMLLWGDPGNGKTSLAEALGESFRDILSFPYAIIVGHQIIRFFDETLHKTGSLPESRQRYDERWVPCHRPVVVAGGELTLEMLDLQFEENSRFYEAPMHLKALGGVFVLDDFGRQVQKPQEFLNRWIVPLEKGFDILSLHTGKKFRISFDQLVVFSSNMEPTELGDDAAQRRIYFKVFVPSPTREDYLQIFKDVCEEQGLAWNQEVMDAFYDQRYEKENFITSGAHPGFLVHHIFAACRYLDREPELSTDLLDLVWRNVVASKRRT